MTATRAFLLGLAAILTSVLAPLPATAQTIPFKCATATLNDVQHEWCQRFGAASSSGPVSGSSPRSSRRASSGRSPG